MRPPEADNAGYIAGGDPLTVGRVSCDGSRISVLAIDLDIERPIEVADENRTSIAIENGVGFSVAGDENSAAAFRGRSGSVGLRELSH